MASPIILQNLLSAAVGAADTFMLGFVGQGELAAVSLANQPQFVLSLFFMGLTSGTGIMMAQFLGKKDHKAVNYIFKLAFGLTAAVSAVFALLVISVPEAVMRIFTPDLQLVQIGSVYLRMVGGSYLLMSFSQVYLVTMKTFQKAKKSAVISIVTLLVNVGLNAVFIFGLLGCPKLGVVGVALATLIARLLEASVCAVDFVRTKVVTLRAPGDKYIRKGYLQVTYPIMAQGLVWGGAMATFSAIMGRMGTDAVAANSIAAIIQNIATVASFGLAEAGSILLGHSLGKGDFTTAQKNANTVLKVSLIAGIACCLLMLLMEGPITSGLKLSPAALEYFHVMYKILSVNVIFAALTYTTLNGIFASGGDTKFGFYLDAAVMWGFCVLLGALAAFVLKLPAIVVFLVLNMDELVKTPFVICRYLKNKWVHNVTV